MYNALYKYLSISCLLVSGVYANQVSADWYSNDPQLNQQQGFGDFLP